MSEKPDILPQDLLPEDAYDGDDPFHIRLRVIERAVTSYLEDTDEESKQMRRRGIIRAIEKLNAESLEFVDRMTALQEKIGDR